MKGRNNKSQYLLIIMLISLLFFINTSYIFSNQIHTSFDPYTLPPAPPSPPSPSPPPPPIIYEDPIANITMPELGYLNEIVVMHGNYSYDPDGGNIIGFRWDFNNDGLFDTDWSKNPFTTYIFNKTGNFTVKLQVKDDEESKDIETQNISIIIIDSGKIRPIAENNGPYWSVIGNTTLFNSSGSYDPDGNITYWLWEFGDGNFSNEINPIYQYKKTGSYIVTLTVKDNDGLINQDFTIANIYQNNTVDPSNDIGIKIKYKIDKEQKSLLYSVLLTLLTIVITTIIVLIIANKKQQGQSNNKSIKQIILRNKKSNKMVKDKIKKPEITMLLPKKQKKPNNKINSSKKQKTNITKKTAKSSKKLSQTKSQKTKAINNKKKPTAKKTKTVENKKSKNNPKKNNDKRKKIDEIIEEKEYLDKLMQKNKKKK